MKAYTHKTGPHTIPAVFSGQPHFDMQFSLFIADVRKQFFFAYSRLFAKGRSDHRLVFRIHVDIAGIRKQSIRLGNTSPNGATPVTTDAHMINNSRQVRGKGTDAAYGPLSPVFENQVDVLATADELPDIIVSDDDAEKEEVVNIESIGGRLKSAEPEVPVVSAKSRC